VQENIDQMEAERVKTPDKMIPSVRRPDQGLVISTRKAGKPPGRTETPPADIFQQVNIVLPDHLQGQGAQEQQDRQQSSQDE
jgi:hypothetical protein